MQKVEERIQQYKRLMSLLKCLKLYLIMFLNVQLAKTLLSLGNVSKLTDKLDVYVGSWEFQTVGKNQPVINFSFWMIITVHFAWSFTLVELMVNLLTHTLFQAAATTKKLSFSSISTFHRLYDLPFMYNAASSEIDISNLH